METIFPETPGASGSLLIGWRRRPGSAVGGDNIEQVVSMIFKQAYTVQPSDTDPAAGSLLARGNGPGLFVGDSPGQILINGDFADGLSGWSLTGGAAGVGVEGGVEVSRNGPGDLRRSASAGRTLRERGVGIAIEASADQGLTLPRPVLVANGITGATADAGTFPAAGNQPAILSAFGRFPAGVSSQSVSARYPAMGNDGEVVTYANAAVTTVVYESDMVPFKPQADLIVIADNEPVPTSIAVDGTVRMSQAAFVPQELTGLGWEDKQGTVREDEAGVFDPLPPQALPDAFENTYFNGYRRNRRQGGSVPYPAPDSKIEITRDGGDLYAFSLPGTAPVVRHEWFTGSGVDDPCLWRVRTQAMSLDTLVVEPDRDQAYAVWRAVWLLGSDLDGTGPVSLENYRRATVLAEGG